MHYGDRSVGNIGGGSHYEYRPVGDTVHTASRIEGLNKVLGTRILVSDQVLDQLDGLLTRELGEFVLAGKSKPIVIHELMGLREEADEHERGLCEAFAKGLDAYRNRSWEKAIKWFDEAQTVCGGDAPARFYIALCEKCRRDPPDEPWDGVIRMSSKYQAAPLQRLGLGLAAVNPETGDGRCCTKVVNGIMICSERFCKKKK